MRPAASHPARSLLKAGFIVTLNTDNRLMSNTSMSEEFRLAAAEIGFSIDDLRQVTDHAVQAAFCDEATRDSVAERVAAGYEAV